MPDSTEHRHQYYLAAIPFVAYFCIFAYEAGRYTYLGIPLDYLEVPVQRIAQLAFIALLCVLIGAALLTFLIALAESKSQNWSFFGKVLLWALPLVGFTALLAPELFNFLMAIGVAIVKATDTPPVLEDRTRKNLVQRCLARRLYLTAVLPGRRVVATTRAHRCGRRHQAQPNDRGRV